MSPFSFQCSLQVELLLAEFFASITLFIIAVSAERTPHALNAPILWRAFLLLGAINTALSYRNVKKAVRGVDNFDFRKAGIVWGSLLISWAMFNAPLEDRLYPGNVVRVILVVPYVLVHVAVVRVLGREHFQTRQVALKRRRFPGNA